MKTLTLSGWGQPHDALAEILPGATAMEYAQHDTIEAALADIAHTGQGHDLIVGWSLGGQLAVRAIAAGLLKPKKLVLIAAPYQFVEINRNGMGMKRDTFSKFFNNYVHDPLRTLNKAWALVHMHDSHAQMVQESLDMFSKQAVLHNDWLKWLDMINGFSCDALDLSKFPPTLLVHGENDVVVEAAQSRRFSERLPAAQMNIWPDCGHAPHWHDKEKLMVLIRDFTHA